jgi:hypothetical protein
MEFANVWQIHPPRAGTVLPMFGKTGSFLQNIGKLRSGWGAALPEADGCA